MSGETTRFNAKRCTDHLGNEFESKTELAEFHGLRLSTLCGRMRRGMSMEEAINYQTNFNQDRFIKGPIENPTAKQKKEYAASTDHKGNVFSSFQEMCRYYKMKPNTVKCRLDMGWGIEKSLTEKVLRRTPRDQLTVVKDHLGNKFRSLYQVANYHGVGFLELDNNMQKFDGDIEKAINACARKTDAKKANPKTMINAFLFGRK